MCKTMALHRCPECNKQISDSATVCPECGYPVAKLEKKDKVVDLFKNHKKSVLIIGGIMALIIFLAGFSIQSGKDGHFRNSQWGMTVEQVQAKEEKAGSEDIRFDEEDSELSCKDNDLSFYQGRDAVIIYSFDAYGQLDSALYYLWDNKDIDINILYNNVVAEYENKYGSDYIETPGYYETVWLTEKSTISVRIVTGNTVAIYYDPTVI